jgi:HlyD family secretion protein
MPSSASDTPAGRAAPPMPVAAASSSRRAWPYVLIAAVILLGGGIAAWATLGSGGQAADVGSGPIAVVTRGPLVVSVTETGEVEAARRKVISNELQWPAIIRSVVDEGATVREGDEIIVFECKELTDAITKQRLVVTDANNAYTQAHQNAVLKRKEVANQLRKAEVAVEDANDALSRYKEAGGANRIAEAKADIFLAHQELTLAEGQLKFRLKVNQDKELNSPFSENDIEAEKLRVERLKLAHRNAQTTFDMLLKYDHPGELKNLEMAVEDAQLALERAKLEAQGQILKAEADELAKKATLAMQTDNLKELEEQATKLVIRAEKEGLVVYNTGSSRWRPVDVVVEVGEKISPRQQLMIIPDMTTLQIETKVYEAIIDQVKPNLKAHIRFDSRPDRIVPGHVDNVGVLPSSQHRWLNPGVKVFEVIVKLDEPVEGLKPGMTAQVEIELARVPDVLNVPVAAVFTEQESTYCYRLGSGGLERVPVTVGRMNDTHVELISGLNVGDQLALAPPPSAQKEKKEEGEQEQPKEPPREEEAELGPPPQPNRDDGNAEAGSRQPKPRREAAGGRQRPRRTGGGAGRRPR